MEEMVNYLMMLSESLDKKAVILTELKKLTNAQRELVEADNFDDDAFNKNTEKKSALIMQIQNMDKGFQALYNNIKNQIENNKERYKTEIELLQKKIATVMDINAGIQAAEARNKVLVEKRFAILKREAREVKKNKTLVANYYNTMNKLSSEPYFLDKKK